MPWEIAKKSFPAFLLPHARSGDFCDFSFFLLRIGNAEKASQFGRLSPIFALRRKPNRGARIVRPTRRHESTSVPLLHPVLPQHLLDRPSVDRQVVGGDVSAGVVGRLPLH